VLICLWILSRPNHFSACYSCLDYFNTVLLLEICVAVMCRKPRRCLQPESQDQKDFCSADRKRLVTLIGVEWRFVSKAPCGLRSIVAPHFLAECWMMRLDRASFVLLCFVLFAFSGLCLVTVVCVLLICLLSCIFQREPTWMALYSLTVLMCR